MSGAWRANVAAQRRITNGFATSSAEVTATRFRRSAANPKSTFSSVLPASVSVTMAAGETPSRTSRSLKTRASGWSKTSRVIRP